MKTRLYKNPPLYFIVLANSVKTKEVEVIEFRRMGASLDSTIFYVESLMSAMLEYGGHFGINVIL